MSHRQRQSLSTPDIESTPLPAPSQAAPVYVVRDAKQHGAGYAYLRKPCLRASRTLTQQLGGICKWAL
jgi:hypothetical protein